MYDRQPFAEFMRELRWRQGEHWFTAAPTQTGKTTIMAELLRRRSHAVVLASKTRDPSIERCFADYQRIDKWPGPREESKLLLWPKSKDVDSKIPTQRAAFKRAMDAVDREGAWCVAIDEYHWLSQFLRLDKEAAILHHEGSGMGITVYTNTQRPSWIPRITYSSCTHALIGNTGDDEDLKTLAKVGGRHAKEIVATVQTMGRHDLLYINPMGDAVPRVINSRK